MTARNILRASGEIAREHGITGMLGVIAASLLYMIVQQPPASAITVRPPAEPVEVKFPDEPPAWFVALAAGHDLGVEEKLRFEDLGRRIDAMTQAVERLSDQLDPTVRRVELLDREVQGLRAAVLSGQQQ